MALRNLTWSEIDALTSRHGVDHVSVENFLCSLSSFDGDAHGAFEAACADALSYSWNDASLEAVVDGIAMADSPSAAPVEPTRASGEGDATPDEPEWERLPDGTSRTL